MKFVKSSLLVKILILALVVYALITLVHLRAQINAKNEEAATLTSSISATEQENERIQDNIDTLDTDEGVERVARDKLGMSGDGEITFYDAGK